MPNQEEPALTLDRALWYGRTYRAHSASTVEETSPQFLKRLSKSVSRKSPQFYRLQTGGLIQGVFWEEDFQLLGEFSTHSFLEYHNGGAESRLSQILQGGQLRKYYLSAKACQGILNRAKRKGKDLPEMLRIALEQQSASLNEPDAQGGGKGILIQDDQTGTLSTVNNQAVCYEKTIAIEGNGVRESHLGTGYAESESMYTLNTVEQHAVCYPINTMIATRGKALGRGTGFGVGDDGDAQFTLSTVHEHAVCYGICSDKSNSMLSGNTHSGIYEADTSRTLDNNCGNPACNQGGIAVCYPEVSRTLSARNDSSPCIDRGQEFCCYPETFQTLTANNAGGQQRMPDKGKLSVICVKDEPK